VGRFLGDKTLVTPIKNLIEKTETLAEGKLSIPERTQEESGEIGVLIKAFYDMADRLALGQKTLQENEARFRIIMDSLDTLIFVVDIESYEILFINEAGKNKFSAITGKTCWQHLYKDQTGPCAFCTNKYLLEKGSRNEVICSREIQNSITGDWYQVHDMAIQWTDGRTVKLEVATDISELKRAEKQRKELEQQIRQKGKMEAVGIMAGGIAHNFNNSLAVILGNIEVSKLKLPKDSPVAPYLEKAKKAINGSSELVSQILTYSSQWTNERTPVQIEDIINSTLGLLASTIPSSITFKKVFSEKSQGLTIHADPSQVQYALINICNNAVYAMEEKGNLIISLDAVNLQSHDIPAQHSRLPGDYIKLSVEDTGSGMPSEILDKIFDPFFTTKEVGEGTGMGLATVQGIMNQHDGLIKVSSTPGQGSIFKLYFPIIACQKIEPEEKDAITLKGTERILFIDDDSDLASAWSMALTEYGYLVTTETGSQRALNLFRENPAGFDLVITDQTMPDLTGSEFIKEILRIRQDIPTILCTGYSHKINEETAQNLGVKAFCKKPIILQDLLTTIRELLDTD